MGINADNVLRLLKQKQETRGERIARLVAEKKAQQGGAATVVSAVPETTAAQEDNDRFFKAGAFSDGYQFGDVIKTILGTAGDVGINAVKGAGSLVEGVTDLLGYAGAGIADLFGADEFASDWKKSVQKNTVDAIFKGAEDYVDQASVLGGRSDAISQGLGQVAAIILTGGAAGAAGGAAGLSSAATAALQTAVTTGVTGLSGMGSGMSQAYQEGATDGEAVAYGAIAGTAEALTEWIFAGMGKSVKALGFGKGLSSADDILAKKLSSKISSQLGKNLVELGVKAGAEGTEEVLSGVVQAFGKKLTYLSEEDLGKIVKDERLFDQFLTGAITSGIAQSGIVPGMKAGSFREANQTGRDLITGLTQNEQAVVDKEFADRVAERKKSGELSKKQEAEIYDKVLEDMEQGRISTDTIESVLGGDTYKGYQSLVEQEKTLTERQKALQTEIDALQNADNTIGNNRKLQKAEAEMEKLTKQLKSLDVKSAKSNLFDHVDKLTAKDTKLRESYNERTRRGQAFTADLTKYDEKLRPTIQRAIDNGEINNTRATHAFVEGLAKIEAEKGIGFDFTNNKKLAELGLTVAGRNVGGYVDGTNVTLNLSSSEALNKVVGHEVTHVFEGSGQYDALMTAMKEFAAEKGIDWEARVLEAKERYQDVKNADPEKELLADLVGEYLFTDSGFVKSLSTKNPGLFKRIYEEIKYLAKTFAGTKQGTALEKVKKTFAELYREAETKNTVQTDGVRYALESKTQPGKLDPRTVTKDDVLTLLHQVEDGSISGNTYIPLRISTPQILIYWADKRNGDTIDNNPIAISADKAYNAMNRNGETSENGGRPNRLTADEIVAMVENMNDPEYIVYQGGNDRYVEVVKFDRENGDSAFAVLEIGNNKDAVYMNGYEGGLYNILVTTYPPITGKLKELLNGSQNKVIYDKKKDASQRTSSSTVPSVLNDASFYEDIISEPSAGVKEEKTPSPVYSLSGNEQGTVSAGEHRITGEDIALAPTREDIAQMEQERSAAATSTVDDAGEELGAPTREDIARMDRDKKLKGPLLMKDSLDRELEKLYRLQQLNQIQDNAYFVELFKVNAAYQAAGRDFTEAFNRVIGAYQGEVETQAAVAGEDSTAVNTDPAQHTPQEQAIIEEYQAAVDVELVNYVEKVKVSPGANNGRYTLKNVSDRAAEDIRKLTDVDVTGNKTQIEGRIVEHILKRHGENGKADHSMRDVNDIARIQYVLDNYDNAEYSGKSKGYVTVDENGKSRLADTVTFSKKVNGTYYVVEAAPDTKSKTVFIVSARMAKNGQKTTQQSLNPVVQKPPAKNVQDAKENTAVVPGTIVPADTVSQNFDDVKSDDEIIKTVKERLSAKITNSTEELSQIKLLRDWVKASYEHKIANLQVKYDGKKNKDTKTAVQMKNRLESLKRISADLDADLQKRISDIEARIAKASEKMAEPSVKDILEVRYERIDKQLQEDKAVLEAEFQKRKADSQAAVADKSEYIRKKAKDLYWELNDLRKGVRASTELGYLKDSGYSWEEIKTALVNVSNSPDKRVNIHSVVESTARQMLNDSYESAVYDADELDGDYQRAVAELEEEAKRQKEAVRKDYERTTQKELHKGIMDRIRDALTKAGFDLNAVLKNAKNLSTFATVDNTPQRVNEKTFGYKAGQVINDLTVNKAALNESDGIQWLNGQIDKIKKLSKRYGIKPGSKESRAAQIYGEGFWVNEVGEYIQYGDAELAADFPDTEKQAKIKALAKSQEVRQMYDDALDAINAARVRNGYPAIPRRDDYFLHFRAMDDTFSKIGVPFNPNDVRAKDLPTDLNGVTADLKPGKPFFASEMKRTGDKTTYDLLGGLERYMNSAKNQIYHIDDIQTFRAMRNYIADMFGQANGLADLDSLSPEEQEQRIKEVFDNHLSTYAKFLNEEANIFAGKTALIDRGVEGVLGRRAIQFLHTLNGQVGKNMVGFNISSAGTNVLPVVQATAMLPKADMVKAFVQTISNKFRNDGFVESDPALIRRKGADQFAKTPWQRISDPGYALMSAVDNLSSELIVRAKYNELVRKGMDSQQAHIRAGEWASRLMGDRSLGQMPQLYNSKTLGLITKFQLEVRNQLDAMGYDVIQEAKAEEGASKAKKAAKVASTMAQLAIFQHLFGQAYESIAGYNPAFDIVENLIKLFGFDDEEESEDTVGDNVEQAFLGLWEDLPYASTFIGGRIPIASALPVKEFITGKDSYGNEKNRWETLAGALPYYVLPGGYGQAKKTAQGLKMFDEDLPVAGSYTDSGNLRFPVEDDSIADWLQAALFGQYASKNARDYFDNGWAPLKEKQIEEFASLDIPIADYREIRKRLGKLETTADKFDYIDSLDLTVEQKNILVNNVVDRKEPVDMTDYNMYEDFDEFDFYIKNQEKYQFLKDNGIAYKTYNASEESREAYSWAFQNPEKYQVSLAVTEDTVTYKGYTKALSEIKADKDSAGKTVSGSRKKKVVQYINGLDAEYGAKLVLYKMEYPSDDTYNGKIIQYVNSIEGFTFEQKATVLKELGFTVTSDGKVTWN